MLRAGFVALRVGSEVTQHTNKPNIFTYTHYIQFYTLEYTHKLALLKLFNRGRQPASWKWYPQHQARLDLFAHLAYPVEFTYHPLPMIPFPRLIPIYTPLVTLLLNPTGALPTQGCLANELKV